MTVLSASGSGLAQPRPPRLFSAPGWCSPGTAGLGHRPGWTRAVPPSLMMVFAESCSSCRLSAGNYNLVVLLRTGSDSTDTPSHGREPADGPCCFSGGRGLLVSLFRADVTTSLSPAGGDPSLVTRLRSTAGCRRLLSAGGRNWEQSRSRPDAART